MNNYKYHSKDREAFSLIELMVVIAIVALLSAVAVPAYQDYITRAKAASGMSVISDLISKTQQYYDIHGSFPSTMGDMGYNTTSLQYPDIGLAPSLTVDQFAAPPNLEVISLLAGTGACPNFQAIGYIGNVDSTGIYSTGNLNAYVHMIKFTSILTDNGIWQSVCEHAEGVNQTPNPSSTLAGCYNDANAGELSAATTAISTLIASCN